MGPELGLMVLVVHLQAPVAEMGALVELKAGAGLGGTRVMVVRVTQVLAAVARVVLAAVAVAVGVGFVSASVNFKTVAGEELVF